MELIRNELQIARTGLRALSIAAHPDDEDGATASYLRCKLGVETHICLSTRGEGGQNESGPELGAKLAVLRTRETETSSRILGAKDWYLNLQDFGFSKSPDEALHVWGHDYALSQMVRVIRIVRPHLIFTNHDPEGKDHGHHVATARLLVEAFDAAADPSKFAVEMKQDGTEPWQVSKLYVRHFAPPGTTLHIDVSIPDAITNLSASEIGAYALSKHVSQGMLRSLKAGEKEMRYFTLLKSLLPKNENEKSMIDGLAINTPEALSKQIEGALSLISPAACSDGTLARAIIAARTQAKDDFAIAHLDKALIEALGIKFEATSSDPLTTYNESTRIHLRLANTGKLPITLQSWRLHGETPAWEAPNGEYNKAVNPGESAEIDTEANPKEGAFPTFPAEDYLTKRIETRKPVSAQVTVIASDPAGGEKASVVAVQPVPLDLVMPFTTAITPDPVLVFDEPAHNENFLVMAKFRMAVTNYRRITEPLTLYAGIQPTENVPVDKFATFTFRRAGETLSEEFRFMAPVEKLNKGELLVPTAVWTEKVNFGGPAARIRRVPMALPQTLHVGLVRTYDTATLDALKLLENYEPGLSVTLLSAEDLRSEDLNKFHTIVLDIRATQYRPELRSVKERLQQFMRDGGNIVCMYNKDLDWNNFQNGQDARGRGLLKGEGGGGEIAPYPIELSFARVTDETAPIRILQPQHPLLLQPCRIWERDFDNWVQERGVYFPRTWAKEYTAILSCNDPGDPPLDGGLLVADVGDGSFIYTCYVWYRQLRAGNPGAYRMLANLISYPRVKKNTAK